MIVAFIVNLVDRLCCFLDRVFPNEIETLYTITDDHGRQIIQLQEQLNLLEGRVQQATAPKPSIKIKVDGLDRATEEFREVAREHDLRVVAGGLGVPFTKLKQALDATDTDLVRRRIAQIEKAYGLDHTPPVSFSELSADLQRSNQTPEDTQ